MTEETAYHLLQRRRRELEAQISALKGQLAPKEAELAQIDKMLSAADPPPPSVAPSIPQKNSNASMPSGDYVSALLPFLSRSDVESQLAAINKFKESATPSPEVFAQVKEALEQWEKSFNASISQLVLAQAKFDPKFTRMTIKELVVQAIIDHFPNGGKVADIREFIREGYGRDIDAASLRPQMHRLKADNALIQNGEIWNLDPQKRRLYAQYNHPSTRAAMPELKDDPGAEPTLRDEIENAAEQAECKAPTARQQRWYGGDNDK
jgi:hypothetical protein